MKKISLFTPCYNEEGNVYELYRKVTEVMATIPEYDYEYVFIDNHSLDNTPAILRKMAAEDKRVKVIFNVRNFGPSRSGSYGFFQTSGDASICLACDFQDPPELIPEFIKKWEEGYKVVWGKRFASKDRNPLLRLCRNMYYSMVKSMADSEQYENVTGFGLYDQEVMNYLRAANDPTPNFRNMIGDFGYEVGFVEYNQPQRKAGKSSYNFFRYLNVAFTSIVTTTKVPLRMATFAGFFLAFVSFIIGIIYLVLKLMFWYNFPGGTAPILIGVFFMGAIQMIFTGIIGEYIGEILTRQMNRPMVVEAERLNFDEEE